MKLNLKPGMRLKNKGGDDVEVLKVDFNVATGSDFCVLLLLTDRQGAQTTHSVSLEGRSSVSRPGVVNPFDLVNPYEELKDGDPVFVRADVEEKWERRHFCRFEGEVIVCYPNGLTGWTYNPSIETLTSWDEVRIPTEEELKAGKLIDARTPERKTK